MERLHLRIFFNDGTGKTLPPSCRARLQGALYMQIKQNIDVVAGCDLFFSYNHYIASPAGVISLCLADP